MRRQLLATAAVSILAAWCAGCAGLSGAASEGAATNGAQSKTAAASGAAKPADSATAQKTGAAPSATNLEDQIRRAQALRAQGDIAGAVRAFAQLVLIAPDDARVVGEYGKSLVQQGRPGDAVAFLKRATQLKDNDWTVYSALGVAYDQLDDRKNAATAYERALALHPGEADVLNNYAVSRMLAGDLDGAQKLLHQAQAAGGSNPKIASNLQLLAQMRAKAPLQKPSTPAGGGVGVAQTNSSTAPSQPRTIVMQQAPADSHSAAEPPKPAHKSAIAAKSSKPVKAAAKKVSPPPMLRTADQGE